MHLSTFTFLIDESGKNIRRNGLMSLAALTTVAVSMAVLGGALWSIYRLHQIAATIPRQFEIVAFTHLNTSRKEAEGLLERLHNIPEVATATLYPREKAWTDIQQEDNKTGTSLTGEVEQNPLPDRLDISAKNPAQTTMLAVALRDHTRFPELESIRDDRETLNRVLATSRLITNIGGVAALALFLATSFVIQNTIRLTVLARRREIRIMQLVGATSAFIRMPMVLEGIFYGITGAAVAAGVVIFVAKQLTHYINRIDSPVVSTLPPPVSPLIVLGLLVILGLIIGWVGSVLSLRRFLRRI